MGSHHRRRHQRQRPELVHRAPQHGGVRQAEHGEHAQDELRQAQRAHEKFIDKRRRGDRAGTAAATPPGAETIGSEL